MRWLLVALFLFPAVADAKRLYPEKDKRYLKRAQAVTDHLDITL